MTNNIFTVLSDEEIKAILDSTIGDTSIWAGSHAIIEAEQLHTLQQVVEWGDKPCHRHGELVLQRECDKCWQEALVAKE